MHFPRHVTGYPTLKLDIPTTVPISRHLDISTYTYNFIYIIYVNCIHVYLIKYLGVTPTADFLIV